MIVISPFRRANTHGTATPETYFCRTVRKRLDAAVWRHGALTSDTPRLPVHVSSSQICQLAQTRENVLSTEAGQNRAAQRRQRRYFAAPYATD